MNRACAKLSTALHDLVCYKCVVYTKSALDLLRKSSFMCINKSEQRNEPEVMESSQNYSGPA